MPDTGLIDGTLKNYVHVVFQHAKKKAWFFLCSQHQALRAHDVGGPSMASADTLPFSEYPLAQFSDAFWWLMNRCSDNFRARHE